MPKGLLGPLIGAVLLTVSSFHSAAQSPAPAESIPAAPREFRAAWIATVANIDWPSKRGMTVPEQKAELIRQLDRARQLNMNAVIFQVRPASDAMYQSSLEPWSEFLTGQQGKPPVPFYDPLQFAVEEAHKRGLELHAWFNPYRASHPAMKGALAPGHISRTHPELVRQYGKYLWLDPGEKGAQDFTIGVILDVVRRYDIDGVHFDDYFYPYKSYGDGKEFPDDPSWQKYKAAGGSLSRNDWRRENVNTLMRRVDEENHKVRPQIRFGVAPFGIWKPGNPPGVVGLNAYEDLYKDARKWLQEGWVDYLSPQLYWKISAPQQSYPALLKWWVEQNRHNRHVWPGLALSSVSPKGWPASEIVNQILATRRQPGSTGNIFFSMKWLMRDTGGIGQALSSQPYRGRALVPASTWLDSTPPSPPAVTAESPAGGETVVRWQSQGGEAPWLWAVYAKSAQGWMFDVLPAGTTSIKFPGSGPGAPSVVAVSAVDRVGNESQRALAPVGTMAAGGAARTTAQAAPQPQRY